MQQRQCWQEHCKKCGRLSMLRTTARWSCSCLCQSRFRQASRLPSTTCCSGGRHIGQYSRGVCCSKVCIASRLDWHSIKCFVTHDCMHPIASGPPTMNAVSGINTSLPIDYALKALNSRHKFYAMFQQCNQGGL